METDKEALPWFKKKESLDGAPDWYQEIALATPDNSEPYYQTATLEEFCGRFDLTHGKALSEIRRCNLWGCGKPLFPLRGANPYLVPLPAFDRYAAIIETEQQTTEPPRGHLDLYMNKRHPAFTSELEAAVSCWQALFADAPPGKVATHTKSKATSWLKQNRPTLDKSQRERIATVLTPDSKKKGGAPPTPE